jgi:PKD repeat protein
MVRARWRRWTKCWDRLAAAEGRQTQPLSRRSIGPDLELLESRTLLSTTLLKAPLAHEPAAAVVHGHGMETRPVFVDGTASSRSSARHQGEAELSNDEKVTPPTRFDGQLYFTPGGGKQRVKATAARSRLSDGLGGPGLVPPVVTATAVQATVGTAFQGGVATFTGNTGETAGQYQATINWGDGTQPSAAVITGSNGQFVVSGSHTYAAAGSDTVSVTVQGPEGASLAATAAATVAVPVTPPAVLGTVIHPVHGAAFTGEVATFTDSNAGAKLAAFTAHIDWGDGHSSTGTIVALDGGQFSVRGSHTYSQASFYSVQVQITDTARQTSALAITAATVPYHLPNGSATGVLPATAGSTPAVYTVATIQTGTPGTPASEFNVSINWGDGTHADTTTGTVVDAGNGRFRVTGSHAYATSGKYKVTVTVTDQPGGSLHVYPAGSVVAGKTLGRFTAEWWQWALSFPAAHSPLTDTTGALAGLGNVGDAFLLGGLVDVNGGILQGTVTRTVTIPSNLPIFFPIINNEQDNSTWNNPGAPLPNPLLTAKQLAAAAVTNIEGTKTLQASVDGVALPNLFGHREKSPSFSYVLPGGSVANAFGYNFPAGTVVAPAVSDGYWVMLGPLAPGMHVLHFGGRQNTDGKPADDFKLDVTYKITVVQAPPTTLTVTDKVVVAAAPQAI